jgi:hypothetical protein
MRLPHTTPEMDTGCLFRTSAGVRIYPQPRSSAGSSPRKRKRGVRLSYVE